MAKPLQLHLVMNELYPGQRHISAPAPSQPMVVQDMATMANFVYNYYMEKVKVMKDVYAVSYTINVVNKNNVIIIRINIIIEITERMGRTRHL